MRPITTFALVAVTAVAVIAAVGGSIERRPVSEIGRGVRTFPGLGDRLQQAARIELARGETRFALLREGDGWVLPDKGNYPARADLVRQTLAGLAELEVVEAKTAKPDLLGRLNLTDVSAPDSQSTLITVKDAGGAALASLLVGKVRYGAGTGGNEGGMIYVRKPGDNQSWLVGGQLDLRTDPVDWAERTLADLASDKIRTITLTDNDGKVLALGKPDPEKSDFALRDLPDGREVKSQFEVNGLAGALEGLTFEDVMPASTLPLPAQAAKAEYSTADGVVVTITLIPRDAEIWAQIAATGTGEEAEKQAKAIQDRVKGWVYRLPDWKRQKMQAKLEELLKPKAEAPAPETPEPEAKPVEAPLPEGKVEDAEIKSEPLKE